MTPVRIGRITVPTFRNRSKPREGFAAGQKPTANPSKREAGKLALDNLDNAVYTARSDDASAVAETTRSQSSPTSACSAGRRQLDNREPELSRGAYHVKELLHLDRLGDEAIRA